MHCMFYSWPIATKGACTEIMIINLDTEPSIREKELQTIYNGPAARGAVWERDHASLTVHT